MGKGKRINSHKKGGRNERALSKWWQEWTGYDFARVPSSGGLRWKRTFDTTGDLICTDQKHALKFPFSIEAKDYKNINFEHAVLEKKSSIINIFWEQAKADAERGDKIPILMMRYNGMEKNEYFLVCDISIGKSLIKLSKPNFVTSMMLFIPLGDLYIVRASEVLEKVNYRKFYKDVIKMRK